MSDSIATLMRTARSAGAWWPLEMDGMLGASLSARIKSMRRPNLRLLTNGDLALAEPVAQGDVSLEPISPSQDQFASLRTSSGVALELPREWVTRHRLQLPLAAASHTRDAIGFMLDRLSPFPPAQVHYATQLAAIDQKAQIAWVEVAIAPRARVEEAIARLAEHDLRPASIEAAAPGRKQSFVFSAAPKGSALGSSRLAKIVALTALIGFGLRSPAVALATEYRAESLEAQVEALRPDAKSARQLIAKTAKQEKALADFRVFANAPLASHALETLKCRLGDESWLFTVEFDQKTLYLHDFARSVPELLRKISSPPFGEAELAGSIVNGHANDGLARSELDARNAGAVRRSWRSASPGEVVSIAASVNDSNRSIGCRILVPLRWDRSKPFELLWRQWLAS